MLKAFLPKRINEQAVQQASQRQQAQQQAKQASEHAQEQALGMDVNWRMLIEDESCDHLNWRHPKLEISLLHYAAACGHASGVSKLLDKGLDPNLSAGPVHGATPVTYAVDRSHVTVLHMLLQAGGNASKCDALGYSPMTHAAQSDSPSSALLLLFHGCTIESKDQFGMSPLHWAAYSNSESMVEFLLEHGADIESKDPQGRTPAHIAVMRGSNKCILLLDNYGCSAFREVSPETLQSAKSQSTHQLMTAIAGGSLMWRLRSSMAQGGGATMFIAFHAMLMLNLLMYFVAAIPFAHDHALFHSIMWSILISSIGMLYWASLHDAGTLASGHGFNEVSQAHLSRGDVSTVCWRTLQPMPARSRYCAQLGRVVRKFDHWCPWLGNAVGEDNHLPFLAFVTLASVGTSGTFGYSMYILPTVLGSSYSDTGAFMFKLIGTGTGILMSLACMMNFAGGVLLFFIALSAWQNAFKNILTYEVSSLHWKKEFWDSQGQFFNPYDKGSKLSNVKDVLLPSVRAMRKGPEWSAFAGKLLSPKQLVVAFPSLLAARFVGGRAAWDTVMKKVYGNVLDLDDGDVASAQETQPLQIV